MVQYNASTGITDTKDEGTKLAERMIAGGKKARAMDEVQKFRETAGRKYVDLTPKENKPKKYLTPAQVKQIKVQPTKSYKPLAKSFFKAIIPKKFLGEKKKGILGKQDKMRVMRLRTMLVQKKLQNQIERLKLQNQIKQMRIKGKLPMPVSKPSMMIPQRIYPMYSDYAMQKDIDSAFDADIGHGDNLFSNEQFYNETYYDEDYIGDEFSGIGSDPLYQLSIKFKAGISPLLY